LPRRSAAGPDDDARRPPCRLLAHRGRGSARGAVERHEQPGGLTVRGRACRRLLAQAGAQRCVPNLTYGRVPHSPTRASLTPLPSIPRPQHRVRAACLRDQGRLAAGAAHARRRAHVAGQGRAQTLLQEAAGGQGVGAWRRWLGWRVAQPCLLGLQGCRRVCERRGAERARPHPRRSCASTTTPSATRTPTTARGSAARSRTPCPGAAGAWGRARTAVVRPGPAGLRAPCQPCQPFQPCQPCRVTQPRGRSARPGGRAEASCAVALCARAGTSRGCSWTACQCPGRTRASAGTARTRSPTSARSRTTATTSRQAPLGGAWALTAPARADASALGRPWRRRVA
jgi:hypothetical protein